MAPPSTYHFEFPRLRTTVKLPDSVFWDIKFYPYNINADDPPIFAIADQFCLLICTLKYDEQFGIEVLQTVKPRSGYAVDLDWLNCCTWCYVDTARPLVAVAGLSGQVKVIDALTGSLFTTLIGHGLGTINDVATHPLYPWIIASASMDASVRVWDLRRAEDPKQSQCVIICGHGQAHKEGLLTLGWHRNGRYLVSGGHDLKICVWTLPDLHPESTFWQELLKENQKRSVDEVRIIHYPHFVTSAIHTNYIDKAVFFGDLVISKSAKDNKIVLWQITGFNSRQEPPDEDTAPKTSEYLDTRNGFMRKADTIKNGEPSTTIDDRYKDMPPYQRHLEFDSPNCDPFYMRFGFLQPSPAFPEVHPTLTMGNTASQIHHWDIERLSLGHDGGYAELRTDPAGSTVKKLPKMKKGTAIRLSTRDRLSHSTYTQSPARPESPESSRRSSSVATPSTTQPRETSTEATSHTSELLRHSIENPIPDRLRYPLGEPHRPLPAHKITTLADFKGSSAHFTARAADWSPCGRWCVVVGESQRTAVAVVLERERKEGRNTQTTNQK